MHQREGVTQPFAGHTLEPAPGLPGDADFIEGHHIRLQRGQLVDDQLATQVPAFVVLFEVERRDTK